MEFDLFSVVAIIFIVLIPIAIRCTSTSKKPVTEAELIKYCEQGYKDMELAVKQKQAFPKMRDRSTLEGRAYNAGMVKAFDNMEDMHLVTSAQKLDFIAMTW